MYGKIIIDGEKHEVTDVSTGNGSLPMITLDDRTEWYVAESSEKAGEEAREYWEDMSQNDEKEFVCLVGESTLIQWALGNYTGRGSTSVRSLNEWLDLWLNTPEEHFASYDGSECEVNKRGPYAVAERRSDYKIHATSSGLRPTWESRLQDFDEGTTVTEELYYELGFHPTVAYRHN